MNDTPPVMTLVCDNVETFDSYVTGLTSRDTQVRVRTNIVTVCVVVAWRIYLCYKVATMKFSTSPRLSRATFVLLEPYTTKFYGRCAV